MNFIDIAEASLKMGLPIAVLSWFMFSWLHKQGKIDVARDRKTVEAELKQMKNSHKAEKADEAKARKQNKTSWKEKLRNAYLKHTDKTAKKDPDSKQIYILDRWMWYGSGFYGLAAIWTFFVIEVTDVFNFIAHFPGLSKLLEDGVFALVISFGVNQITNIFSCFAWFTFWTRDAVGAWILVAYLGYLAGMKIAKFDKVK